jgi:hypothetical protein
VDISEAQFRELLAELVGRANRMLAERSEVFPMGILLTRDGCLDVSVAAYEFVEQIPALLNAMQSSMAEKTRAGDVLACCIAYPDYDAGEIIALLENNENYCATALLPVAGDPPAVDLGGIRVQDGSVNVFAIAG